jgi:hypothetical protein
MQKAPSPKSKKHKAKQKVQKPPKGKGFFSFFGGLL